jgi:hypothetical protein
MAFIQAPERLRDDHRRPLGLMLDARREVPATPLSWEPRLKISCQSMGLLVACADGVIIIGTSLLGGAAYQTAINSETIPVDSYLGIGILTCFAYELIGWNAGNYRVVELGRSRNVY